MKLQRCEVYERNFHFELSNTMFHSIFYITLKSTTGEIKSISRLINIIADVLDRKRALGNEQCLFSSNYVHILITHPHRVQVSSFHSMAAEKIKPQPYELNYIAKPSKHTATLVCKYVIMGNRVRRPLQSDQCHKLTPNAHRSPRSSLPAAGEAKHILQPVQETHTDTCHSIRNRNESTYSCDQKIVYYFYKDPVKKTVCNKQTYHALTVDKKADNLQLTADCSELDLVDLKLKTRVHRDSGSPNKVHTNKCSKHLLKANVNKEKCIEALRKLIWLPPRELVVPQVGLTVAVLLTQLDNVFKNMAEGDIPGPQTTMRFELLRVCTLRNYPRHDKPYIIRLAQAGFYYAGEEDEVICYVCGMRKRSWCQSDIPMNVHRQIGPNCRFLTHNFEVNVPVPPSSEAERKRFACLDRLGSEQSPSMSSERQNSAGHASPQVPDITPIPTPRVMNDNLRISDEMPKFPHYSLRSTRLSSFVNWPDNTGQVPETLVDAGFYYADIGDCVRCFHCGIGLRHWTVEDDVWIEHARWARNCRYLNTVKGDEFIRLVHLAIEYTQDDDEQPAATNGATGNTPPSEEIERILRSTAAQSVLEMGYQPKIIKKAIEKVLAWNGIAGITADMIMDRVLEIEEEQDITNRAAQLTIAETTSNNPIVASDRRDTDSGRELTPRTDIPETTPREERIPATTAAAVSIPNASSASEPAVGENKSQHTRNAIVTTNADLTISSGSYAQRDNVDERNNSVKHATTASDVTPITRSPEIGVFNRERKDTSNQSRGETYQSVELTPEQQSITKHRDTNSLRASKSLKAVREENEALKVQTMCKVCMDKMVCVVFLPCGHLVTCEDCAPAMRKCPICRTLVKGTVKTFMA